MTHDNADDHDDNDDPTIFSATLTPHRSLSRVGFLVLMLLFGGVSFVTGMLFLDEKAGFAKELGKALIEARRGPTRTVFE